MERETSLYHLLSEHQFVVFIVRVVIPMGLLLGFGMILGRYAERRRRAEEESGMK